MDIYNFKDNRKFQSSAVYDTDIKKTQDQINTQLINRRNRLMYDPTQNLIYLEDTDVQVPDQTTITVTKMNSVKYVTVPVSGWTDTAPYTQTITVSGMKASDAPEIYLHYPDTITSENAEEYVESYGYIHKVETKIDAITITAFIDKPTMDITLALKGV